MGQTAGEIRDPGSQDDSYTTRSAAQDADEMTAADRDGGMGMAPYGGAADSAGYSGSASTDAYRVANDEDATSAVDSYGATNYADSDSAADMAKTGEADDDDTNDEDAAQIRAQIEQTRSEMSETIDAIQGKLNPDNLKEQAQEMVREATVGRAQEAERH